MNTHLKTAVALAISGLFVVGCASSGSRESSSSGTANAGECRNKIQVADDASRRAIEDLLKEPAKFTEKLKAEAEKDVVAFTCNMQHQLLVAMSKGYAAAGLAEESANLLVKANGMNSGEFGFKDVKVATNTSPEVQKEQGAKFAEAKSTEQAAKDRVKEASRSMSAFTQELVLGVGVMALQVQAVQEMSVLDKARKGKDILQASSHMPGIVDTWMGYNRNLAAMERNFKLSRPDATKELTAKLAAMSGGAGKPNFGDKQSSL